jgi:hypothetical protein
MGRLPIDTVLKAAAGSLPPDAGRSTNGEMANALAAGSDAASRSSARIARPVVIVIIVSL